MTWTSAYLTCFLFGVVFAAITAAMGHFGGGDAGGQGDIGDAGDAGHLGDSGHASMDGDMADGVQGASLPLFSPSVLAILVTMFGGSGYLLIKTFGVTNPLVHASGAAAISLTTAFSVAWLMMKLMNVAETNSFASHRQVVGRTVEITQSLRGSEPGEIAYEAGGTRHTLVARSLHGESFLQGAAVQVVEVLDGTAVVAPVGTVSAVQQVVSPVATGTPVHSIKQDNR